ncbi:MAG TPA: helix-hairpin-helix domain-containing protein, partial [Flavobacteriaceae bacterium]|nr:helix-hairpin-helix domain-containing protein [Flavobacteriaceae bacterium]
KHFKITSLPEIKKVNVNTASFKQVLHLPYIDYELTKKIFNYRDEVAEIQSLDELKKIDDFPLEKFNRIALYLEAK